MVKMQKVCKKKFQSWESKKLLTIILR
jgi:hypothetical protein